MMDPGIHDRRLAADYLLGRLDSAQADTIRERLFTDSDFFDLVVDAEYDLLDAYAGGRLPSEDRLRVEQHLLTTREQVARLEAAYVLAGARRNQSAQSWFNPRTAAPIAAALVLFAGLVWMFQENRELNRQLTSQTAEEPSVFAFTVSTAITRAAQSAPAIKVPASANFVRIDVPVNAAEPYATFAASVSDSSGARWTASGLPRSGSGLQLFVPSTLLRPGQYEVAISGLNPQRVAEPIGFAYFRIEP